MATEETIARALRGLSAAMPMVVLNDDIRDLWMTVFGPRTEYADNEIISAVRWYVEDMKKPRWPVPSEIRKLALKARGIQQQRDLAYNDCRECVDGLLRKTLTRKVQRFGEAIEQTYGAMVPCDCAAGRSKQMFLQKVRADGRAVNKNLALNPGGSRETHR